jgi:hypothetical protein
MEPVNWTAQRPPVTGMELDSEIPYEVLYTATMAEQYRHL